MSTEEPKWQIKYFKPKIPSTVRQLKIMGTVAIPHSVPINKAEAIRS